MATMYAMTIGSCAYYCRIERGRRFSWEESKERALHTNMDMSYRFDNFLWQLKRYRGRVVERDV